MIERPDAGTTSYRIELLLYDDAGNMSAPDAAPTIALVNQNGDDRSSRLDSATMSLVSTGRYRAVYTASTSDAIEQLVWTFSVVVGGVTRLYTNTTQVVDTTAVDFTSDDRSKLAADLWQTARCRSPARRRRGVQGRGQAEWRGPGDRGGSGHAGRGSYGGRGRGRIGRRRRHAYHGGACRPWPMPFWPATSRTRKQLATRCSLATVVLATTNKANTVDNPGRLTVYRTDGVTSHAQIPISTDPHANPIDGVG